VSFRPVALPVVVLCATFAATLWTGPWADERVNDLFVYRTAAEPLLDGELPYREVFLEYPPLAAPVLALPGLAGTGEDAYRLAFAAFMLLVALAVLLLTGRLAQRSGGDPARAMLWVALAPLVCGAMIRTHFDLVPVALTLAALALLVAERPRLGFAVLGLGAMTKGFPLVVAAPALAWLAASGERRAAFQGAAVLAAVVVLFSAIALTLSASGAWEAVDYHLERPVQIESVPASIVLALDGAGLGDADGVSSHRSDGLEHPAADALAVAFGVAMLAVVALFAFAATRGRPDARGLVLASLAAVAAFAAVGKVLSPQFLVWLVPLGALAFAWRMHALAAACAGATLLTLVEFPARYADVVDREPFPLVVVAARNAVMLLVLWLAWRGLRYSSGSSSCSTDVARPSSPASTTAPLSQRSPSAGSKRTWVMERKRSSACSRFTPITPAREPVIPTSLT
jgi:Glycosyltransferase family 87